MDDEVSKQDQIYEQLKGSVFQFAKEDKEMITENIDPNQSYPNVEGYEYVTELPRIDFDKERDNDFDTGRGFLISSPKATIKKDIKNPNGIYSTKFGQRLGDLNPFMDRYSCECGELRSRINHGIICKKCHTICKFVDDDFSKFGWIVLKPEYHIIHPDLYKNIDSFFGTSKYNKYNKKKKGSVLQNIIDYDVEMNIDGFEDAGKEKPDEPFYGIGMIEFYNRFDEILEYYYNANYKKSVRKKELYEDIITDRDKIFTHSIPVFTTHLRPFDISDYSMYFEKTTGIYNMMVKLAAHINKNRTGIDRTPKLKNQQLFNLQTNLMKLYDEIIAIISGKKGNVRMLLGGRFNFSSRAVIVQDVSLRIDQVKLPYVELVITHEQQIINILHRTYNITLQDAYDRWYKALSTIDPTVVEIINAIIRTSCNGEGIPVIINRNPTIAYGGIMQVFCVGINFNYCLSMSLQDLQPLAADRIVVRAICNYMNTLVDFLQWSLIAVMR